MFIKSLERTGSAECQKRSKMLNSKKERSGENTPAQVTEKLFDTYYRLREVKVGDDQFKPELIKQVGSHPDLDALFSSEDTEIQCFPEAENTAEFYLTSEDTDTTLGFFCDYPFGYSYENKRGWGGRKDCFLIVSNKNCDTFEIFVSKANGIIQDVLLSALQSRVLDDEVRELVEDSILLTEDVRPTGAFTHISEY